MQSSIDDQVVIFQLNTYGGVMEYIARVFDRFKISVLYFGVYALKDIKNR
ncbi:hypothetical protein [Piscirickettsia salmonis]|nr:hypothetical protein [Piscirickettsia salmonis]